MSSSLPVAENRLRDSLSRRRGEGSRREKMLNELEDIFLAEGFSALTVDELCRRLRCSKSTLYSIASTREQIVQAVVRHFFARSTAMIEDELEHETDAATRVVRYLAGVGAAMRRNSQPFYEDMVTYQPTAEIYRLNSQAAKRRGQGMVWGGGPAGGGSRGRRGVVGVGAGGPVGRVAGGGGGGGGGVG